MEDNKNLVPFGKYKGKPLEVLLLDEQYCDWILKTENLAEKYPIVINYIINNIGELSETPQHNRLQCLFLDRDFCLKILKVIGSKLLKRESSLNAVETKIEELRLNPLIKGKNYFNEGDNWKQNVINELVDFRKSYQKMVIEDIKVDYEFECSGWDVKIMAEFPLADKFLYENRIVKEISKITCLVEIKPDLGENYPAILRQMKTNAKRHEKVDHYVLVYENFSSSNLNLEQIKQIFIASGFNVLSLSDINQVEL